MDNFERLLAQLRLVKQAEQLRQRMSDARRAEVHGSERHRRLCTVIRRHDDRINRRAEHYRALLLGRPVVTTNVVAAWVRAHIAEYRSISGCDAAEVAGEVTQALRLWDEHNSIPGWVHGVCERICARDRLDTMAANGAEPVDWSRCLFVEKKVNYEDDGNVLLA